MVIIWSGNAIQFHIILSSWLEQNHEHLPLFFPIFRLVTEFLNILNFLQIRRRKGNASPDKNDKAPEIFKYKIYTPTNIT